MSPELRGTMTSTESALFCVLVAITQACPAATAMILPVASTVATAADRVVYVTDASVASTAPALDVVTSPGDSVEPIATMLTLFAGVPNVLMFCAVTVSVTVS